NRAYQTKSALLGGLEGLTERWALFCAFDFLQNVHKISGSFTLGNVNAGKDSFWGGILPLSSRRIGTLPLHRALQEGTS
ncbi:MAG: hypothetical protein RR748_22645, partial [Pseudomonas sp.]